MWPSLMVIVMWVVVSSPGGPAMAVIGCCGYVVWVVVSSLVDLP